MVLSGGLDLSFRPAPMQVCLRLFLVFRFAPLDFLLEDRNHWMDILIFQLELTELVMSCSDFLKAIPAVDRQMMVLS